MLYLHGGGYIGTSPNMYSLFIARLARATHCEIFVADYRLAPEFPYPAALDDALAILDALRDENPDRRFLIAGDSGGGGLAGSLLYEMGARGMRAPVGVLLFSPEISLVFDEPSVTENAPYDVLPWNIPTNSYLHGLDPRDVAVSGSDVTAWPPTFIVYGGDEIFRDPIRELVDRLRAAGVPTDAHEQPGMFHVFPVLVPWAASSRATYAVPARSSPASPSLKPRTHPRVPRARCSRRSGAPNRRAPTRRRTPPAARPPASRRAARCGRRCSSPGASTQSPIAISSGGMLATIAWLIPTQLVDAHRDATSAGDDLAAPRTPGAAR